MSAAPTIPDSNGVTFLANLNTALVSAWDASVHQANAYTTGGTSSAYTLTPAPVLAANAALVRYTVTFSAAGSGSPTLAVSGLAALPLMAYNGSGALVSYLPSASQVSDVVCDGTHWIVMDALPAKPTSPKNGYSTLTGHTTGNSAVGTWTGDVVAEDANGIQYKGEGLTLTNTLTTSGASGLDTGMPAYITWYYIFAIYNPTAGTWSTLASTSLASPTMPSGYTAKCLISAVFTQSATSYFPLGMTQTGNKIKWKVGSANVPNLPLIASGSIGNTSTPTYVSTTVAAFAPPNAAEISLLGLPTGGAGDMMVAPNGAYGAWNSLTNPAPLQAGVNGTYELQTNFNGNLQFETAQTIYIALYGAYLFTMGFSLNM